MPGMTTPTLLQMSQGYQTGGFVTPNFTSNPMGMDFSSAFQDLNQQQIEQSLNIQPPQITAETTPPPPSVDGGGTGATGTDFSDPAAIAASLGFNPSQYSEYFTAITPEMQAATQEGTYDPFYAEQIEQIRGGIQGRTEGLRQNLLQSAMQAQQAGAASGFAGGAAGGARTEQLMRQSAEQQQAGIGRQYEAQRRGVQEQIASRIGAAQDAIERARQQNIATARGLIASGAEFGTPLQSNIGPAATPQDIITQFDTPEQRYGNMQTFDSLLTPTQMPNALPRGPGLDRPIGAFDPRTIRGY
tara:strand:+ start:189 stop:1091 length:903 start_codon:yes stop_codon:yes gene_type:complete